MIIVTDDRPIVITLLSHGLVLKRGTKVLANINAALP
jgi:hypothetical protein